MPIFILCAIFFVSCSQETQNLPPSATEVEPLYTKIEKSNEPINDGVLSINIEDQEPKCHPVTAPISIKLVFENMSNQPLLLQSRFILSQKRLGTDGDIFVWLSSKDGISLLSPSDTINDEQWGQTPTPLKYLTLDEFSKFETTVHYKLPLKVMNGNAINEFRYFTPRPGQYLIKVVYQNLAPSHSNEWGGVIASNQIEVCFIQ